jgi:hypothetical protein
MKPDRRDLVELALTGIQKAALEGGEIWTDEVARACEEASRLPREGHH